MHPLREKNKIPEKAWQKFTASSRANKMHMGRIPIWNPKLAKIIGKEIKKSTKTTSRLKADNQASEKQSLIKCCYIIELRKTISPIRA